MNANRTGRRQLTRLADELSERDTAIIAMVGELRLMTARHIERAHFPTTTHTPLSATRTARRVLARLTDTDLLRRLKRRIGGVYAGSAGYVYRLGPTGQRLLYPDRHRLVAEPSVAFLKHTVAVSEVVVGLIEAERAGQLELVAWAGEPRCWQRFAGRHGVYEILKPDLRLITARDDFEQHFFVEVDLGTEHRGAVFRKCRQYQDHYRLGDMASAVHPRVAWLAPTEERANWIAKLILQQPSLTAELFAVRSMDAALDLLAGGDRP